ncbi:MAG: nucleoside hydrolase [Silicimonas sp.]|nr:nucleoside hydrolase [Silicimonas sp.]
MTAIWVDTDFGFDDLWALLLLRQHTCAIAGVSLVAGNAPLPQVIANGAGAYTAYNLTWPLWSGADRPLTRPPESAQRILGPTGIRSRGKTLPIADPATANPGATDALRHWLTTDTPHTILALGPLTNIATLLQDAPETEQQITRLVWMGGSSGPGNHSPRAEFNALADAEALAAILATKIPLDIVDLQFCRQFTYGAPDMPNTDPLTADLLGGYLDIALERGRTGMAIYDPLAALALTSPDAITFTPCAITISTAPDDSYGATTITPTPHSTTRIATKAKADLARLCLDALTKEALHGK